MKLDITMENFGQPRLIINCRDIHECDTVKQALINHELIIEKVNYLPLDSLIQELKLKSPELPMWLLTRVHLEEIKCLLEKYPPA